MRCFIDLIKVLRKLDGKDLILVVRYRIRLLIPVISMTNGFETAQKVTVRIWGKE